MVKNRIHINRFKLATDRFNFDTSPPPHIDATPPAILNEDELPDMNDVNELLPDVNVNVNEYNRDEHENIKMHENFKNEVMINGNMNMNDNTVNDNMFEIEKILRKRKRKGQWEYRVKWRNFPASDNSWENFDNPSVT